LTQDSAQVSLIAIVLITATSETGRRRRRRRTRRRRRRRRRGGIDKKTPWTDARSPDLGEER
jgi:hypothetical protein